MMELLNEFLSGSVAWGVLLTLAAFALGALVNRVTGKAFFNPLLLGAIFVIVFLSVCGIPYADYKVELFIQRDGQRHGGGQQQVVHRGGADLVVGIGDAAYR